MGHHYDIDVDDVDDVDVFVYTIPERSDVYLARELDDDYEYWMYPDDDYWYDDYWGMYE